MAGKSPLHSVEGLHQHDRAEFLDRHLMNVREDAGDDERRVDGHQARALVLIGPQRHISGEQMRVHLRPFDAPHPAKPLETGRLRAPTLASTQPETLRKSGAVFAMQTASAGLLAMMRQAPQVAVMREEAPRQPG